MLGHKNDFITCRLGHWGLDLKLKTLLEGKKDRADSVLASRLAGQDLEHSREVKLHDLDVDKVTDS